MNNCIILSHVFVHSHELEKHDYIDFAIKHWRKNNPQSYIIVTGHGLKPDINQYCDYVHWEIDVDKREIGVGHPRLCNIAFDHAKRLGFQKILKSRLDTVHLIPNLCDFSESLLKGKKMLVTQQTSLNRVLLGDLFLYGDLEFMKKCWDIQNWYPTKSGLTSLAMNFFSIIREQNWHEACINNLSFVDIFNLKWICLKENWDLLQNKLNAFNSNNFDDWHLYLWASRKKRYVWNNTGKLIANHVKLGQVTTEEDWH